MCLSLALVYVAHLSTNPIRSCYYRKKKRWYKNGILLRARTSVRDIVIENKSILPDQLDLRIQQHVVANDFNPITFLYYINS